MMVRLFLIALCSLLWASSASASLLVSHYLHARINRFNHATGAPEGVFADVSEGTRGPEGMTIGPDGNVYVVMDDISNEPETIGRFTQSGEPLGTFTTLGSGTFANQLTFGPDGNLYVSFAMAPYVRRYDGTTGAFIDSFADGGGLSIGSGLIFGPDANLYVSSYHTGSVKRYSGGTGQYMGDFAAGLIQPTGLVFGPDGNLYVASRGTDQVKRYDGTTGAFLGNFAVGGGLDAPGDLAFGPDGNVYVASFDSHEVKRYDGATGAFIDNFVPAGGTMYPTSLLFIPRNIPEPSTATLVVMVLASFLRRLVLRPTSGRKIAD